MATPFPTIEQIDDPTTDPKVLLAVARSTDSSIEEVAAALANPNISLREVAIDVLEDRTDDDANEDLPTNILLHESVHATLANPAFPLFLLTDSELAHGLLLNLLRSEIEEVIASMADKLDVYGGLHKPDTKFEKKLLKAFTQAGLPSPQKSVNVVMERFEDYLKEGDENLDLGIRNMLQAVIDRLEKAKVPREKQARLLFDLVPVMIRQLTPDSDIMPVPETPPLVAAYLFGFYD